jgi:hypothetical protein
MSTETVEPSAAKRLGTHIRRFRVSLEYYKPSGKYYTSHQFEHDFPTCGKLESYESQIVYLPDVCDFVRKLAASKEPGALPGLSGTGWDGPVAVRTVAYWENGAFVEDSGVPQLLFLGR